MAGSELAIRLAPTFTALIAVTVDVGGDYPRFAAFAWPVLLLVIIAVVGTVVAEVMAGNGAVGVRNAIAASAWLVPLSLAVPWTVVPSRLGMALAGPASFFHRATRASEVNGRVMLGIVCIVACGLLPVVIAFASRRSAKLATSVLVIFLASYGAVAARLDVPALLLAGRALSDKLLLDVGEAAVGPILRLLGVLAAVASTQRSLEKQPPSG